MVTRVLLGDFEPMFRLGLEGLLVEAGCELVGEETVGVSLLDRTTSTAPDVVIVDPLRGGTPVAIAELTTACPALIVVACSSETSAMRIFPRFHHGESYACTLSPEALTVVAQER